MHGIPLSKLRAVSKSHDVSNGRNIKELKSK